MTRNPSFPRKVFFDGGCGVCSSEMRTYRRREHGGRFIFIDIRGPRFDPSSYGISKKEFIHELHAIDSEGRIYRGMDAIRAIWRAFPDSNWFDLMEGFLTIPGINLLARLFYRLFARGRKHLPKK